MACSSPTNIVVTYVHKYSIVELHKDDYLVKISPPTLNISSTSSSRQSISMILRGPSSVLSRHWLFGLGRLGRSRVLSIPLSHSYYSATAKFTDIDPKGAPVSYDTGIMVGEPHQSYIYVEPEVGNAIRSSIIRQLGSGVSSSSATLPLQFNHKSRAFAHSTRGSNPNDGLLILTC